MTDSSDVPEWGDATPRRLIHPVLRLGTFLVLMMGGAAGLGFLSRLIGLRPQVQHGALAPQELLPIGALIVLLAVGVTWIMVRRFEGRGLRTAGLGFSRGFLRRAGIGFFFGGLTPALVATGLAIAGIARIVPSTPDLLALTLPMTLAMIFISSWEELLLRGYFMQVIGEMGGVWVASAISGIVFGLMHAGNPGANPAGLIITGANGILLALLIARTGSLWLACGYHTGWNVVAAIGFGLRDSGMLSPGALLSTELTGPTFLTGGAYGFEASLVSFVVEAAVLAYLLVYGPRWAGDTEASPYYQRRG